MARRTTARSVAGIVVTAVVLVVGGIVVVREAGHAAPSAANPGGGPGGVVASTACTSAHVAISLGGTGHTSLGTPYHTLEFLNTGTTACELPTYPQARGYDVATTAPVGPPASDLPGARAQALGAGSVATVQLSLRSLPPSGCHPTAVKALDVSIDGVAWTALPIAATLCADSPTIQVSGFTTLAGAD